MTNFYSIIKDDKFILNDSERTHVLSMLDVFEETLKTFNKYPNRHINITLTFKDWKGWIWNSLNITDLHKMDKIEEFSDDVNNLKKHISGFSNKLLPDDTSLSTYNISLENPCINLDDMFTLFCSKNLRTKVNYLLFKSSLKTNEKSASRGKI